MESIIQTLKQRLEQAEEELAFIKRASCQNPTPEWRREKLHATHRAFWQVRDASKELTELTKEIARTHQKNTN